MSETVWADWPGRGQVPFDPDTCETRIPLRVDGWPKCYLYQVHKSDGDLWIYAEEEAAGRSRRNPYTGRSEVERFLLRRCRVVTEEEAREMRREAGLGNPPVSEDRRVTEPAGPGRKPLPDRLELILDVFKKHGLGPHRGKDIAAKAGVEAFAHVVLRLCL
jgi:hypothetical protein